jgi:hypothetical protein
MDARYVLFLDGGKTTGWALYDREIDEVSVNQFEFAELGIALESWMREFGGVTTLGAEKFVITPMSARKDADGLAIQVYGIARWYALKYGAVEFVGDQNSSSALHFVKDAWLKRIGWYQPKTPHGMDAARHVIKFLERRRCLPSHIRGKIVPE